MTLVTVAGFAGCGGNSEPPSGLSEGAQLASRLPSDDALNVAMVDVAAVRRSLGLPPGVAPPTGFDRKDRVFLDETGPALGLIESERLPRAVSDTILAGASSIVSVSGDRAATAVATSTEQGRLEAVMRANGLQEQDGSTFVPSEASTYAIGLGDGLVVLADDPDEARSILEETGGKIPDPLGQVDGDGELVTLVRFGSSCVDSVATSDSVAKPGEVAFFTSSMPDPEKIQTDQPSAQTRVVDDSARVAIPAAAGPDEGPPALDALSSLAVSYDC